MKQQQQRRLQQIGQQQQRQHDDTQCAAKAASARQEHCADFSAKLLLACICKVLIEQAVIYALHRIALQTVIQLTSICVLPHVLASMYMCAFNSL